MIKDEKAKLTKAYEAKATEENARRALHYVQAHFAEISDDVKKVVYQELLDRVELFPKQLPDGLWVRSVHFKFPVLVEGELSKDWYAMDLPDGWNIETHAETVVLMSRVKD